MPVGKLTLKEAIKAGDLEAFVRQAEAENLSATEAAALYEALDRAIKPPPAERQTSRSASRGGSRGK